MKTILDLDKFRDSVCLNPGLTILCGAGISMIKPTLAPSGNQLRDMCVKKILSDKISSKYLPNILKSPSYQKLLPESVLQDVASFASNELDRLMSIILEHISPNSVHQYIATNYHNLFTTNFDLCFEKCTAKSIGHLHGSIIAPRTLQNRVFRLGKTAEEDFRRFKFAIKGQDLLIIGYSLRDSDVIDAIEKASPSRICYLSHNGNLPQYLNLTSLPVVYTIGAAETLFNIKTKVSISTIKPRKMLKTIRQPSIARRANVILYICYRSAKYIESEIILKEYLPFLRGRGKYKAIYSVADCLRIGGLYDEAIRLGNKILRSKFANRPDQADLISSVYVLFGLCDLDRKNNNYDQIENWFLQALDLTDQFSSLHRDDSQTAAIENWKARIFNNLGELNATKGDYKKAIKCYKKSLKIKEYFHEGKGVAQTKSNLAKVYLMKRNLKLALECLNKVVELMNESPDVYICRDAITEILNLIVIHYGLPSIYIDVSIPTITISGFWDKLRKLTLTYSKIKPIIEDLEKLNHILVSIK